MKRFKMESTYSHACYRSWFYSKQKYLELKHFNYTKLRKPFMTVLLKLLYKNKYISLNEKQIQYILYKNGYYIYAPKTASFNTSQKLLNYITRYISRPVIATSRILNYDGEKVTYFFNAMKIIKNNNYRKCFRFYRKINYTYSKRIQKFNKILQNLCIHKREKRKNIKKTRKKNK